MCVCVCVCYVINIVFKLTCSVKSRGYINSYCRNHVRH